MVDVAVGPDDDDNDGAQRVIDSVHGDGYDKVRVDEHPVAGGGGGGGGAMEAWEVLQRQHDRHRSHRKQQLAHSSASERARASQQQGRRHRQQRRRAQRTGDAQRALEQRRRRLQRSVPVPKPTMLRVVEWCTARTKWMVTALVICIVAWRQDGAVLLFTVGTPSIVQCASLPHVLSCVTPTLGQQVPPAAS